MLFPFLKAPEGNDNCEDLAISDVQSEISVVPEAPTTPRSNLGELTPAFDPNFEEISGSPAPELWSTKQDEQPITAATSHSETSDLTPQQTPLAPKTTLDPATPPRAILLETKESSETIPPHDLVKANDGVSPGGGVDEDHPSSDNILPEEVPAPSNNTDSDPYIGSTPTQETASLPADVDPSADRDGSKPHVFPLSEETMHSEHSNFLRKSVVSDL